MKQFQWFPGHMTKALKEIQDKIKVIDVVLELVDSRAPLASENPELQKIIANKPRIRILTKKDLANSKITDEWKSYFESKGIPTLCLDLNSSNLNIINDLAKQLLQDKFMNEQKKGLKPRAIRYLIAGIPNVGKSTLINRLCKKKATIAENRPGVTKSQQWIKINKEMELLDTPGVLWPNFEDKRIGVKLALIGTIKNTILPTDILFSELIKFLSENFPGLLSRHYEIEEISVIDEQSIQKIINSIGIKRGYLLGEGKVDENRVMSTVIKDFQNGNLGKISLERVEK
ncbi:MAG: ribosome biogenesis GTPase YlqF [Erysipelotrichales bacterium]|nr:ribosome biogenesis GTPase YlqF [Erysipelotrichales bacterium]